MDMLRQALKNRQEIQQLTHTMMELLDLRDARDFLGVLCKLDVESESGQTRLSGGDAIGG